MIINKKSLFAGSFLLTLVILSTACQQKRVKQHTEITAGQDSLAVVPFQLEHGGWGYKINIGAKTHIYQDIIPTIQGRHIFQTKEDAEKVGDLMVKKMRQTGSGLPVISRQEMLDLKIAGVE
jgi:hypothetical protein